MKNSVLNIDKDSIGGITTQIINQNALTKKKQLLFAVTRIFR